MRMVDIIERKRDGETLTNDEIRFFIDGYTRGEIPDYQASSFAMATLFRGMNKEEIATLTDSMMHSGDVIDLSSIKGVKVDKHSTGGVGDKTSLALGPLVAACGAKVAKMSGRGLGHTGGTLDKMESIPGMRIELTEEEFINQVNSIGIAIMGQTKKLVPADKKLYALRDVTGTVESIPLIASSIMSKKLASGSDSILLDVKFGRGAFMKTFDSAKTLAETMVEIGDSLKRDTRAIITDMNQPLGLAVGNALEVKEAIDTLNGHGPKDFVELVRNAGSIMLQQAGIAKDMDEGFEMIDNAIENRSGLEKLKAMVKAQGGDESYISNPEQFPVAKNIIEIKAVDAGYIERIDSLEIGLSAMRLGAGRETMADKIDMSAGIVLSKKVGDKVEIGDILAYAHTNHDNFASEVADIRHAFSISHETVSTNPIIHAYIKK
ncbi:MAG: pyrimidine-nucleoside phosphorylase [Bacilli bacterium]|nr:pyrimidine-nucleoside phosphorylase [Bacilli bacterium]